MCLRHSNACLPLLMRSKNKFRGISGYIIVENRDYRYINNKKKHWFWQMYLNFFITLKRMFVPNPWIFIQKERVASSTNFIIYKLVTNNHEEITKSKPVAGKLLLSCYHEIRRENIIYSQLRNNASKLHKDLIRSFLFVITVGLWHKNAEISAQLIHRQKFIT